MLIEKINKHIRTDEKYICITRPRRFGKTINANMLGAYYIKGFDSHELFDRLSISQTKGYESHLNKHHVIYIDFSRMPQNCDSYDQYISSIYLKLEADLKEAFGVAPKPTDDSIALLFQQTKEGFIFLLDEWDSIFYKDFTPKAH